MLLLHGRHVQFPEKMDNQEILQGTIEVLAVGRSVVFLSPESRLAMVPVQILMFFHHIGEALESERGYCQGYA